MQVRFDVSPTGITAHGVRERRVAAQDVRRVHLFVDANGDAGLVVRKSLWHFVYVPAEDLRDPALLGNVRSLLDRIRDAATVDPQVDEFLAGVQPPGDQRFASAA
jgi:hypothetical protein